MTLEGVEVNENVKFWVPTVMAAVSLLLSGLSLSLNDWSAHQQNDEGINIDVDPYGEADGRASVICNGLPSVAKLYRISIVNTGHAPLTIRSVTLDTDGDERHLGAMHTEVVNFHDKPGEFLPPPLKLDPGDVRSFVSGASYAIAPAVVSLLCNPLHPLTTQSQIARTLIEAKVDLLGKPIDPLPAPASSSAPAFLFSNELSNLPTLRITVKTEKGTTKTYSFNDKAGP